jgi:hypothetical protein
VPAALQRRAVQMIERHGELLREGHKVVGTTGWR